MTKPYRVIHGDNLQLLRALPAGSVHCVVTSPPYFWQRDYGTGTWRGGDPTCTHQLGQQRKRCRCGARYRDRQVGLEATPAGFAHRLVKIFREIRRVLRDDGVVWLNLGDSYVSRPERQETRHITDSRINDQRPQQAGLKIKDLIGIPWLVAFALRADGWYLRADIIWAKSVSFCPTYIGTTMPSAVADRPTKAHEYLFLLSKQPHYYYDKHAIAEPAKTVGDRRGARTDPEEAARRGRAHLQAAGRSVYKGAQPTADTRNVRSVWAIQTEPSREQHFAQFPHKLVAPCILAGTSERGCCPQCGTPWHRIVQTDGSAQYIKPVDDADRRGAPNVRGRSVQSAQRVSRRVFSSAGLYGWKAGCKCGRTRTPVPCVVLDPFSGSGTTGIVALQLHRHYLGLELSHEYVRISRRRLRRAAASAPAQLTPLFSRRTP